MFAVADARDEVRGGSLSNPLQNPMKPAHQSEPAKYDVKVSLKKVFD